MRNLVRFLSPSDADVDDVTQVACVEVLQSLHSWRGDASLDSWALRITARVARRHAGKAGRERVLRDEATPELRAVREPPEPPDRYLERRQFVRLLDELASAQREVLVLHHVMGMSVPEVAVELGIPFETARSRLRLGRKRLRALYAEVNDE